MVATASVSDAEETLLRAFSLVDGDDSGMISHDELVRQTAADCCGF